MSGTSKIEWTDATWNPVTGCTEVSPGCAHCYAKRFAERFRDVPGHPFEHGFDLQLRPDRLEEPWHWRKPRRVFVCSMADLFHEGVPDGFIAQIWDTMCRTDHTYQLLTKRPERMHEWMTRWNDTLADRGVEGGRWKTRQASEVRERYSSGRARLFADMLESMGTPPPGAAYPTYDWMEGWRYWRTPANVWLGTSIENDRFVGRADYLRQTPAAVRFISAEPLLGPLPSLDLTGIDQLIVGGESGPGARPMHPDWVRDLRDRCQAAGVAFFFKQWGEWQDGSTMGGPGHDATITSDGRVWPAYQPELETAIRRAGIYGEWPHMRPTCIARVGKHAAGRLLDGRTWDEFPR